MQNRQKPGDSWVGKSGHFQQNQRPLQRMQPRSLWAHPGPNSAWSGNGVCRTQQSLTTAVLTPSGHCFPPVWLPGLFCGLPARPPVLLPRVSPTAPVPSSVPPSEVPWTLESFPGESGMGCSPGGGSCWTGWAAWKKGRDVGKLTAWEVLSLEPLGWAQGENFSLRRKAHSSQTFPDHVHGSLEAREHVKNILVHPCMYVHVYTPGLSSQFSPT